MPTPPSTPLEPPTPPDPPDTPAGPAGTTGAGHARAVGLALLVTVLWSSSWVLIRYGLDDEDLPPITFAALRYGLAAVLLLALTARSAPARTALADGGVRLWGRLALLGVGFYALTQGAQFVAIDRQPAATTSLVLSLTPLLVAFGGGATLGERASRRQVLGAVLVVIGAATFFAGDLGATDVGMIAATLALASNAASALLGRHVNRDHAVPAVAVTAVSMAVGAVVLIAVGLLTEGWPALSVRAGLIIGWLAVVNTAVAFTLWNGALRHLSAVESSGINNTMLVQIAVLAWIFLGEGPGVAGLVGIVVVAAGVFLTQRNLAPSVRRRAAVAG